MPPALMAATPVGAAMTKFLCVVLAMCRRNVVLPVPAFPVKNKEREVQFIKSAARAKVLLEVSVDAMGESEV